MCLWVNKHVSSNCVHFAGFKVEVSHPGSEGAVRQRKEETKGRTCLNVSVHTLRQTPLTHHNSSSLLTNPDRLSAFIYSPFAMRKAFMRAGTVYISDIPLSAQSRQLQFGKEKKCTKVKSFLFFFSSDF